jgi:hypothetical protein
MASIAESLQKAGYLRPIAQGFKDYVDKRNAKRDQQYFNELLSTGASAIRNNADMYSKETADRLAKFTPPAPTALSQLRELQMQGGTPPPVPQPPQADPTQLRQQNKQSIANTLLQAYGTGKYKPEQINAMAMLLKSQADASEPVQPATENDAKQKALDETIRHNKAIESSNTNQERMTETERHNKAMESITADKNNTTKTDKLRQGQERYDAIMDSWSKEDNAYVIQNPTTGKAMYFPDDRSVRAYAMGTVQKEKLDKGVNFWKHKSDKSGGTTKSAQRKDKIPKSEKDPLGIL